MKTIKIFKNNALLTFTKNKKIKIYIDDNYEKFSLKKGYKINLIDSSKGSYKGSFMNNYICKKFISNQKLHLVNIETKKILNYCKYFLLSDHEYNNYFLENIYQYSWFLRSPSKYFDFETTRFQYVYIDGNYDDSYADESLGFIPFFMKRRLKNENNKNF